MKVKIFDYNREGDYFTATTQYKTIADRLKISEWNPVVWIGRFFCMDNDFGEHWFDNWDLVDEAHTFFAIEPDRFKNDEDGPCHNTKHRKMFWTSVLQSLELDMEVLFEEARSNSELEPEILEKIISSEPFIL